MPPNLTALLAPIKSGIAKYSEAFDKTATNLLLGDELQRTAISPLAAEMITKLEAAKVAIGQHFEAVNQQTNASINGTKTMQEVVAGIAAVFGLLVAFFIARGITRPLAELVSDADRLSGGDTSAEFKTAQRGR